MTMFSWLRDEKKDKTSNWISKKKKKKENWLYGWNVWKISRVQGNRLKQKTTSDVPIFGSEFRHFYTYSYEVFIHPLQFFMVAFLIV